MRQPYATPMAMRTLAILLAVAFAGMAQAHPRFGSGPGGPGIGGGMAGMGPPMMGDRRGDSDFDPRRDDPGLRPHRDEQDYARDAMRSGAIRPLRDIAGQWRGAMPGYDYIGSEFDPGSASYRLKFMREGSVVWVDVDGRGREIRRSGR